MPAPIKYEIYQLTETRGDGIASKVREVECFYRVSDGTLLWLVDPLRNEFLGRDGMCRALKSRGRCAGYTCERAKGHPGDHAAFGDDGLSLAHAWSDSDSVVEPAPSHELHSFEVT